MAQFFWGHPETFQAARIKADRSLGVAADIGAGIGKIGGGLYNIARSRQQEKDQVDTETAKFEAMLGRAQKQVELESTNAPEERAMQMETYETPTTFGEPLDTESNQPDIVEPISSSQSPANSTGGNPLSTYGKAVMERGKIIGSQATTGLGKFASSLGAFFGVSRDEDMHAKRMNLARLAGVAEKQKMNAAMDRAVAGTLPKYKDPALALDYFRGDTANRDALDVAPSASRINEWTLREDARLGDPIAKGILEDRHREQMELAASRRSNINIHTAKLPQTDYQANFAQARKMAAQMIEQYHGISVDPVDLPSAMVKEMADWLANKDAPQPSMADIQANPSLAMQGGRKVPRPPIEDPNYLKQHGVEWIIEGQGSLEQPADPAAPADPNGGYIPPGTPPAAIPLLQPGDTRGGLPRRTKPGQAARPESNQKIIDQETGVSLTE